MSDKFLSLVMIFFLNKNHNTILLFSNMNCIYNLNTVFKKKYLYYFIYFIFGIRYIFSKLALSPDKSKQDTVNTGHGTLIFSIFHIRPYINLCEDIFCVRT